MLAQEANVDSNAGRHNARTGPLTKKRGPRRSASRRRPIIAIVIIIIVVARSTSAKVQVARQRSQHRLDRPRFPRRRR